MKLHANGHAMHLQPINVCTTGGGFLSLVHILACYPQATVVIYPSDHFVSEEHQVLLAVNHAVRGRNNAMVLAAKEKELRSSGCVPERMSPFERRSEAVDTIEELRVLDATDEALSHRNFSSPLLHFAPERLSEEVADTLDKAGKPMACVKEPLPFLYQGWGSTDDFVPSELSARQLTLVRESPFLKEQLDALARDSDGDLRLSSVATGLE